MGGSTGANFAVLSLLTLKKLCTLERLLTLVPQVSSLITDLEVTLTVRIKTSRVFMRASRTDQRSLPGLIPLRYQVEEMLHRLANANVNIVPFTIGITSETALLPLRAALLLFDYIPASYNTPESRALLPERMDVGVEIASTTRLMGRPETRHVLGGDDLQFAVNHSGIENVLVDVLGMELDR
jgi:hypothetical protein